MSIQSNIEWTESTWNPVTGCTKISSGCLNCYAEAMARRLKAMNNPRYSKGFDVNLHADLIELPLSWKKPRIVFVNSMSDLFHDDVPDDFIHSVFAAMNKADWHIVQVLTKRSKRLRQMSKGLVWPENIWMGVTVEDNSTSDRIMDLMETGAAVKFISFEPLLEDIHNLDLKGIDWVIVGGESGPRSRPINAQWIRNIRNLCLEEQIPFFFNQWGGINKKRTGRELDGEYWNELPDIQVATSL